MRCKNCHIDTNNISDNCPLCGKTLSECSKEKRDIYPNIEHRPIKAADKWLEKLILVGKKINNEVKKRLRF